MYKNLNVTVLSLKILPNEYTFSLIFRFNDFLIVGISAIIFWSLSNFINSSSYISETSKKIKA